MFKKTKFLLLLLLLLCSALFLLGSGCQKPQEVCLEEHCFQVEIANTPEARAQGLMFRESISKDKGMLFIFPEEELYGFWMKNTKMALDIIWLDSNGKVVFISHDTQPCQEGEEQQEVTCPTIMPDSPAKYVLEINAGMAESIELEVGDILTINVPQEIIKNAK